MKYLILASLLFVGCANVQKRSTKVNPGDSKEQVIAVMGDPENRQFKGNQEAWQYCDTSFGRYNYSIIWFNSGVATGVNSYVSGGTPLNFCAAGFQPVRWETAPDSTVEIRNR
jgi:hypothetical protein